MEFERSTDYRLIRYVMTHPKVYPRIGDDSAPGAWEFEVNEDPRIWYVLVRDRGELLGLFVFMPRGAVCFEMHVCLLPFSWGRSTEAGRGVLAWMFDETKAQRIVGGTYLSGAVRAAKRWGMTEYGRNERSILKHGILYDEVLLGISRA